MNEKVIIKANKFHADTGFKFADYSDKSFQLINLMIYKLQK